VHEGKEFAIKMPLQIIGDWVDAQMNKQLILATITCANINTQGQTIEKGASNHLGVVVEHMSTSISSLTKSLYDVPK